MRAVVFVARDDGTGTARVDDVPAPRIQEAGDALVAISRTAICGSDLHLLHGKTPGMRDGSVIGHEFVGTVSEVGDAASAVRAGDRVLGSFLIICGACGPCARGAYNLCRNRRALGLGSLTGDLDGAQAEYVRVPNADLNLKRLEGPAAQLDDEHALFAGDVLATGFHAADISEITTGDTVVVIGAGPVGLFAAAACKVAGAGRVLVLDTDPQRVAFARDTMALESVDVSEQDPYAAVAGATNGAMADVVIEAVGAVAAIKTALKCVREGGRVSVVGVYGLERLELALGRAWASAVDIRFSGMANVQGNWDDALTAITSGALDPTAVITHRLPLDEAEQGYELFAAREAMKVVLEP